VRIAPAERVKKVAVPKIELVLDTQLQQNDQNKRSRERPCGPRRTPAPEAGRSFPETQEQLALLGGKAAPSPHHAVLIRLGANITREFPEWNVTIARIYLREIEPRQNGAEDARYFMRDLEVYPHEKRVIGG
jgi:hypothetical protein